MSSIREVAERASVSLGTVSNVLNHPEVVAESTRQRVLAVIDELGFVRNGSAHQLRAGRSRHIGLVVLDVANPFFTEVARGVEDVANESGYLIILCNSDNSLEKESRYVHVLQEQRAAGVLITPVLNDMRHLDLLRQQETAVVLLDRPSEVHGLCSVAVDDVLGGELATRHLLELGHRSIAFISGPLGVRQCADRRRGMIQAVKELQLDPEQVIIDIPAIAQTSGAGEQCTDQLLSHECRPTAAFCANDLLAMGVLRGLIQREIKLPERIALVGYDDVDFASTLSPALTSIRQPKYQLGRAAAELLLGEILEADSHQHNQIVYQPELIVRASTVGPKKAL